MRTRSSEVENITNDNKIDPTIEGYCFYEVSGFDSYVEMKYCGLV